jgi:hypothetical protein
MARFGGGEERDYEGWRHDETRREARPWRDEWRGEGWRGAEWRGRDDWRGEDDRREDWRARDDWRRLEPRDRDDWRDRGQWGGGPPARWARGESRGVYEREDRGPIDWLAEKLSTRGRGPKGYKRSDERIHDDVCERIARSGIDASEVEVKVERAEVTLAGTVHSRADKWRLEDVADDVYGVDDVHNHLRVERERAEGKRDVGVGPDPEAAHWRLA